MGSFVTIRNSFSFSHSPFPEQILPVLRHMVMLLRRLGIYFDFDAVEIEYIYSDIHPSKTGLWN